MLLSISGFISEIGKAGLEHVLNPGCMLESRREFLERTGGLCPPTPPYHPQPVEQGLGVGSGHH